MAKVVTYFFHFSHPHHKLAKSDLSPSRCNICGTDGSGPHYQCEECNFNLHESCSKFPDTISFFAHPWHNLHLLQGESGRDCDLCFEPVNDFYYSCISCGGFDVHPHCTTIKQIVRSELHPQHDLYLLPGSPCCHACDKFNGLWLYSCGFCEVSFHIKCLHGAIMPKESAHPEENCTNKVEHGEASNTSGSQASIDDTSIGVRAGTETSGNMITDTCVEQRDISK